MRTRRAVNRQQARHHSNSSVTMVTRKLSNRQLEVASCVLENSVVSLEGKSIIYPAREGVLTERGEAGDCFYLLLLKLSFSVNRAGSTMLQ